MVYSGLTTGYARSGPVIHGSVVRDPMALSQRLEIRQSHALVMTPQLMQAIKLLQLSNLDLASYVDNELERNPLLERSGDGEGDRRSAGEAPTAPDAAPADWAGGDAEASGGAAEDRGATELDDVPPAD